MPAVCVTVLLTEVFPVIDVHRVDRGQSRVYEYGSDHVHGLALPIVLRGPICTQGKTGISKLLRCARVDTELSLYIGDRFAAVRAGRFWAPCTFARTFFFYILRKSSELTEEAGTASGRLSLSSVNDEVVM